MSVRRGVKSAATNFVLVFGIGFALGPIRAMGLEPSLGARTAELIEAPLMLLAGILAGRWVGRRLCAGQGPAARLGVGLGAADLVLAADLAVGIGLRGLSVIQVLTGRDPVSGSVYYALSVSWVGRRPYAIRQRIPPVASASSASVTLPRQALTATTRAGPRPSRHAACCSEERGDTP